MVQKKTFPSVMAILDLILTHKYFHFLKQVWKKLVSCFGENSYRMLKKLYDANFCRPFVLKEFIGCRIQAGQDSAQGLLKKLATDIIDKTDKTSVDVVCRAVKPFLLNGFYWESIRWICSDVLPPRDLMEIVLMECSRRNKKAPHIQEVFEVVRDKMTPDDRRSMDYVIYTDFLNIAERNRIDTKSIKILPVSSNNANGIDNNNQFYVFDKAFLDSEINTNEKGRELIKRSSTFHPTTLDNNSPLSEDSMTKLDEGVVSNNVSYNLLEMSKQYLAKIVKIFINFTS